MQGGTRSGEVDSLRCFAMLAVVAQHCGILPFGWTGVWLFYVISGFVVTLSLMRHGNDDKRQLLASFYARRSARIIPVYAFYLLLGVTVLWALGKTAEPGALISLLLFYNNFAMIFGFGEMQSWPVGHLWTISVEMQFYALYGFLFAYLSGKRLLQALMAMLILSPVARGVAGMLAPEILGSDLAVAYGIYATSFLHFDSFAIGALLALNWSFVRDRGGERLLFSIGTAALGLYVLVYAGVNHFLLGRTGVDIVRDILSGIMYGNGREIWLYSAVALFACGVLAWTAAGTAPWRTLTGVRLFQRIGEVSYGAYIFHALAITLVFNLVGGDSESSPVGLRIAVFVAASLIATGAAMLSFRYIEKPLIGKMNRALTSAHA
ncbi:acyltransferase family protein [Shinella zoogloeoides]|uniref:Acyltransferase family protein n=1 Tax=Shinella zoogloeoides TaxID=352475 RepID=A0A6N8TH31_SHIZO|nr:acyltransferase [Shinella zoogloeoides]MXO00508.1 acyltransferase family protein [Shinella zoogloeoides]UEX83898.1 acyltransferase [Shinella zoogloeoides]